MATSEDCFKISELGNQETPNYQSELGKMDNQTTKYF
jgi:hypothetical protein